MRATVMHGAGDVRIEIVPDLVLQEPTDAVVRVVRVCVCGGDPHPHHSVPASAAGVPMGHEFLGVVEETQGTLVPIPAGEDCRCCCRC